MIDFTGVQGIQMAMKGYSACLSHDLGSGAPLTTTLKSPHIVSYIRKIPLKYSFMTTTISEKFYKC